MRRETIVQVDPRAASIARAALDEISSSALRARLDDAKTVISEVLTNAVKYGAPEGRGEIRLVIESDDDRLHVRVEQSLPALEVSPSASPDGPHDGGFGLRIVEALTDAWGVEPGPPGCVWFQFEA